MTAERNCHLEEDMDICEKLLAKSIKDRLKINGEMTIAEGIDGEEHFFTVFII